MILECVDERAAWAFFVGNELCDCTRDEGPMSECGHIRMS